MKKIALLLALLMLVLCCVGCGGEEKAQSEQAATGAAATEQQESTSAAEPDIENCPMSEDGKHQYEEELISEATCTVNGLVMHTCVLCQESITQDIPAHGHDGTGASCEEASICTICFEVAEGPWGHESDGGICKNCGIDMMAVPTEPQTTVPAETEEVETTEAAQQ